MKNLAIILIPLIIVQFSFANNGDTFPSITGESLKNKMIELPKAAKGKYCLIGMASSKKAEADFTITKNKKKKHKNKKLENSIYKCKNSISKCNSSH